MSGDKDLSARRDDITQAEPQSDTRGEDAAQGSFETKMVALSAWSGPLPQAEELARYEATLPGAADRIITMAEAEGAHRRALEIAESESQRTMNADIVKDDMQARRRGQWLGFSIALASIIGAVVSIQLGAHPSVSAALVGVPILGVVRALIGAIRRRDEEE